MSGVDGRLMTVMTQEGTLGCRVQPNGAHRCIDFNLGPRYAVSERVLFFFHSLPKPVTGKSGLRLHHIIPVVDGAHLLSTKRQLCRAPGFNV